MPTATLDGIGTHYEVIGDGPPLLMYSPGGFDASLDKWSTLGIYARIKLLDHLAAKYRCITFDRRETGQSGGRIEPIQWDDYVVQGKALLEHLGIPAAHVLGGCMGCPPATAFGVKHPDRTLSMVLYWPVGGARFRLKGHRRFDEHLSFVEREGLAGVAELAKNTDAGFGKDPRLGPWVRVIRSDAAFASEYAAFDLEHYKRIVADMSRTLLDRDTAPGPEPEDLKRLNIPTLIIPGDDDSHATSAARYLEECMPGAEYWDVPPDGQTEATAPARVIDFLDRVSGGG
jgi:pimeloyl-ACP methyl ester carboxylesterase